MSSIEQFFLLPSFYQNLVLFQFVCCPWVRAGFLTRVKHVKLAYTWMIKQKTFPQNPLPMKITAGEKPYFMLASYIINISTNTFIILTAEVTCRTSCVKTLTVTLDPCSTVKGTFLHYKTMRRQHNNGTTVPEGKAYRKLSRAAIIDCRRCTTRITIALLVLYVHGTDLRKSTLPHILFRPER